MEWLNIKDFPIDEEYLYFLTDGKTVFMKRDKFNPIFIQLYGEFTTLAEFKPTYWTRLPPLFK